MNAIKSALFVVALGSTIVSCSGKDDEKLATSIEGEYAFVGLSATTATTFVVRYDGSTDTDSAVVTASYEGAGYAGTVTIDPKNFLTKDFAYSINGTMKGKVYSNGELVGEEDQPIDNEPVPASSGSSEYKLVGTDSIYFAGGFITSPDLEELPAAARSTGGRYKWSGDTLIVTTSAELNDVQTTDGTTSVSKGHVTATVRLKKK